MKTLSLFALLAPLLVVAQNDYFANDPIWRQTDICGSGEPNAVCVNTDHYTYWISGDSLVQGNQYHKIHRSGVANLMWLGPQPPLPWCTGSDPYTRLGGLVRQDGLRIWQWTGNEEELLYDFELTVGQTLPLTANNWNTDITVLAIDSFLVGAEWRKRFELGNSWAPYLLEGIGSTNGLFEPVSNFFDCGYELVCFGIGDEAWYPEQGPNCQVVMGVGITAANEGTVTVFPVPANGELQITSTDAVNEVVRLFDTSGHMVLNTRMTGRRMTLIVAELPDGLYVIQLGSRQQRVIITH